MGESFSAVYKSARSDPRTHAALWILTSLIWIAFGIKAILLHKLNGEGWLVAPVWGFLLILWLYRLYQAFQDHKHKEVARKSLEEHPWRSDT